MDKEGLIPPELFYMGLTVWVSSDPLGLAASQANFYPPPPEWLHDKYDTTGENLRSESRGSPNCLGPGPHRPSPEALPTGFSPTEHLLSQSLSYVHGLCSLSLLCLTHQHKLYQKYCYQQHKL